MRHSPQPCPLNRNGQFKRHKKTSVRVRPRRARTRFVAQAAYTGFHGAWNYFFDLQLNRSRRIVVSVGWFFMKKSKVLALFTLASVCLAYQIQAQGIINFPDNGLSLPPAGWTGAWPPMPTIDETVPQPPPVFSPQPPQYPFPSPPEIVLPNDGVFWTTADLSLTLELPPSGFTGAWPSMPTVDETVPHPPPIFSPQPPQYPFPSPPEIVLPNDGVTLIQASPTPEPTTYALLTFGGMAAWLLRKRNV
jgi:PEP-CTERM motif